MLNKNVPHKSITYYRVQHKSALHTANPWLLIIKEMGKITVLKDKWTVPASELKFGGPDWEILVNTSKNEVCLK